MNAGIFRWQRRKHPCIIHFTERPDHGNAAGDYDLFLRSTSGTASRISGRVTICVYDADRRMRAAGALHREEFEAHLDMIVIVGFLTIVIVGTILPFCLYLAAVKHAGSVYAGLLSRGAGSGNDRI